jgi:hypothetical protein
VARAADISPCHLASPPPPTSRRLGRRIDSCPCSVLEMKRGTQW